MMNAVVGFLACATLAIWTTPVDAQPLFRSERNWTIEIDGLRYGFRDVVQTPGEIRWTQLWIADHPFEPGHRPADVWLLAVPSVAAVLTVRHLTVDWEKDRRR
jgi:hypothetical protein